MTQGEDKELGEIARSIEAIFARAEHQEIAAVEPVLTPDPDVDTPDPIDSADAVPAPQPDVDAPDPILWSEPAADAIEADSPSESEVDGPDPVVPSEPEVEAADPVLAPDPDPETPEPFVSSEEESEAPELPMLSAEEPDGRDEDIPADSEPEQAVSGETHTESGPPLGDVEQALSEVTANYLRVSSSERGEAGEALRVAVKAAHSARALDAIASNIDILLLQASGDAEIEDLANELIDADVSTRMVVALGRVREEEQREALIRAYTGLGASFAKAIADVLTDTEDRLARKTYVTALGAFGEVGVHAVDEMLNDSRWFVVRNGVAVLGVVGEANGVEALTATLANEHPSVRRETVRSLAKIGGENAGLLVSSMLGDSDPEVRTAAAGAISTLKVEKAYKPLIAILKEGDEEAVIEAVLRALGALGDASAVPAIGKQIAGTFFSRPPTAVRIAGYAALVAIGTPHAVSLVEKAREDKDPEVSAAAKQLLAGK